MPCGLTFRTVNSEHYKTLFKHGDDLRQDQLILQMIELMDKVMFLFFPSVCISHNILKDCKEGKR